MKKVDIYYDSNFNYNLISVKFRVFNKNKDNSFVINGIKKENIIDFYLLDESNKQLILQIDLKNYKKEKEYFDRNYVGIIEELVSEISYSVLNEIYNVDVDGEADMISFYDYSNTDYRGKELIRSRKFGYIQRIYEEGIGCCFTIYKEVYRYSDVKSRWDWVLFRDNFLYGYLIFRQYRVDGKRKGVSIFDYSSEINFSKYLLDLKKFLGWK